MREMGVRLGETGAQDGGCEPGVGGRVVGNGGRGDGHESGNETEQNEPKLEDAGGIHCQLTLEPTSIDNRTKDTARALGVRRR